MNLTGVANIYGTNALPLNIVNVSSIVATGTTPAIGGFKQFNGGTNCTFTNIYAIQNANNNMNITGVSNITGYDLYMNNPNNDLDINGLSSITCATGSQITGLSNIDVTTINGLPATPALITIPYTYTLTKSNISNFLLFKGSSATTMEFTAPTFTSNFYFTFINANISGFNMTVNVNGASIGTANLNTSYTIIYAIGVGGGWKMYG